MNRQKDISRKDATLIREYLLNEASLEEQEMFENKIKGDTALHDSMDELIHHDKMKEIQC